MKTIPRFAALAAAVLLTSLATFGWAAAEPARPSAQPDHIVSGPEIQSTIDQKVQSEASDREAIRELLARPEVQRVAGPAGLDLQRADAAVGVLSGPELSRLAAQARDANSRLAGGDTIVITWPMVVIIVVALVVLIAIL